MRARVLTGVRAAPDDEAELVTQLLAGEAVELAPRESGGAPAWSRVRAPWQPSSKDPGGYPGWVRTSDLVDEPATLPTAVEEDVMTLARAFLDTTYVWGGMTDEGIDCSGLVHVAARSAGLRVPRDAYDQAATLLPVAVDDVRPGDLWFFARPGRRIHHVGFVARPGWILHASDATAGRVLEEELAPERVATLVAAGRIARG
ncbi:MAG: C40 family peptidase [Nocardioides sp.]